MAYQSLEGQDYQAGEKGCFSEARCTSIREVLGLEGGAGQGGAGQCLEGSPIQNTPGQTG